MNILFEQQTLPGIKPPAPLPRAFVPKKSLDLLVRAAVVKVFAHTRKIDPERARGILAKKFPAYGDELTGIVCRAATLPASTLDAEWAGLFVVAIGADLITELIPRSAFAQLATLGMSLTFGVGNILVPNFIPSSAGVFVREGDPIPVIQGTTTAQWLTRRKMACIVSYSGELDEGGILTFEGILRTRLRESTSVALDSVLLDDQPATDVRPAGLLNGAAQVTTTGRVIEDLQVLGEELFTLANHHVRIPALIMNTAQAFAARLQLAHEFMPLIGSASLEAGTVIMVDAADFACAGGLVPRFDISREAALHFEDETPEHLHGGSPVRSLWQEETLGLRMVLYVDWLLRRPGMVAFMRNVHWG
jgi:hypothetical protein